jgi:hypothetical protein
LCPILHACCKLVHYRAAKVHESRLPAGP